MIGSIAFRERCSGIPDKDRRSSKSGRLTRREEMTLNDNHETLHLVSEIPYMLLVAVESSLSPSHKRLSARLARLTVLNAELSGTGRVDVSLSGNRPIIAVGISTWPRSQDRILHCPRCLSPVRLPPQVQLRSPERLFQRPPSRSSSLRIARRSMTGISTERARQS